jgi:hypothetical protein
MRRHGIEGVRVLGREIDLIALAHVQSTESRSHMNTSARVSRGLAATLFAGGVLLAGASGASASSQSLPTPPAPTVQSATIEPVSGAFEGTETVVKVTENTTPPPGATLVFAFFDNGKGIDYDHTPDGGYAFPLNEAPAGSSVTAKAFFVSGNPDDGTQQFSQQSPSSNAVVVQK